MMRLEPLNITAELDWGTIAYWLVVSRGPIGEFLAAYT